jgi:hypothetical protein
MYKHLIALAAAAFVAGCGGGSDETPAAPATPAAAAAQLRTALAAAPQVSAAASPAQAADQLLDFAEANFPQFFPSHQATGTFDPFLFRYYPQTGIYVGVVVKAGMGYALNGVYVMGGSAFGNSPVYVGPLTQFITPTDPGTGGPTGPNNGLALHDTTGTRIVVTYEHTGTSTGTQTMDWLVNGPKNFESNAAIETTLRLTGSLTTGGVAANTDFTTTQYGRATGAAEYTHYGSEFSMVSNLPGGISSSTATKSVYTPPWVSRVYGLALGQSVTESSTDVSTTTSSLTIPGGPAMPPTTTTSTNTSTQTTRFVAREQVTVPAGTYSTCKFETTIGGMDGSSTSWVIDGKGIAVKMQTTSGTNVTLTQQATSVKLNGQNL